MAKKKATKVIMVESNATAAAIRKQLPGKKLRTLNLWVRKPDDEKLIKMKPSARLCRCRSVCIAVLED